MPAVITAPINQNRAVTSGLSGSGHQGLQARTQNPAITPFFYAELAQGRISYPYTNQLMGQAIDTGCFISGDTELPPGLRMDSRGFITGTPSTVGTFLFKVIFQALNSLRYFKITCNVAFAFACLGVGRGSFTIPNQTLARFACQGVGSGTFDTGIINRIFQSTGAGSGEFHLLNFVSQGRGEGEFTVPPSHTHLIVTCIGKGNGTFSLDFAVPEPGPGAPPVQFLDGCSAFRG